MLGSGINGFLALSACFLLCCGGTETSGSHSAGGSAGTGTDTGTAGSSNSNADALTELFSSAATLCEKIAACYPDLQTPGASTCTAPASGGRKVVYQNPQINDEATAPFRTCFDEYPGPTAELDEWVQCSVDASANNLGCYDDCPADAAPCSEAGNLALEACHVLPAQAKLKACTDAQK